MDESTFIFAASGVIARPAGVHYNYCATPSVRGHLVKMLITFVPHDIFCPNHAYVSMSTLYNHRHT